MPGKQNVGYIIPATIAQMFLSEVQETGGWSGVSELGVECRRLERTDSAALFAFNKTHGSTPHNFAPNDAPRKYKTSRP